MNFGTFAAVHMPFGHSYARVPLLKVHTFHQKFVFLFS